MTYHYRIETTDNKFKILFSTSSVYGGHSLRQKLKFFFGKYQWFFFFEKFSKAILK